MLSRRLISQQLSLKTAPTGVARCFKSTISPVRRVNNRPKSSWFSTSAKLYLLTFAIGGAVGLNLPLYTLLENYVDPLPNLDRDADVTLYQMALENRLNELPIVKKLEQDPDYIKIRAWENIDDSSVLNQSMTSKTLRLPGGFAIQPMIFINEKDKKSVTVLHVGKRLTGYPFLIHGGILATILDETLKRCSALSFKQSGQHLDYEKESTYAHIKGASLALSYKFPTIAGNFIVVKAECGETLADGKVPVTAKVQTTKGRDLVVADAVFWNDRPKRWWFFWSSI